MTYYGSLRGQCPSNFEVIYVTLDATETTFTDEFATMPWLAIPFGDPRIAVSE